MQLAFSRPAANRDRAIAAGNIRDIGTTEPHRKTKMRQYDRLMHGDRSDRISRYKQTCSNVRSGTTRSRPAARSSQVAHASKRGKRRFRYRPIKTGDPVLRQGFRKQHVRHNVRNVFVVTASFRLTLEPVVPILSKEARVAQLARVPRKPNDRSLFIVPQLPVVRHKAVIMNERVTPAGRSFVYAQRARDRAGRTFRSVLGGRKRRYDGCREMSRHVTSRGGRPWKAKHDFATNSDVHRTWHFHIVRVCRCWPIVLSCLAVTGCHALGPTDHARQVFRLPPVGSNMPRELDKVIMPEYRIEPPDVVTIEALQAVPKAPYRIRALDVLAVNLPDAPPGAEVSGDYPVQVGGVIDLGPMYHPVKVSGLTTEQAAQAITEEVKKIVREPEVRVTLSELGPPQQVAGDYLVGPDGTVTLGSYGSVPLAGKTLADAKQTIEAYLAQYLEDPEVSVTVAAYNSKVYYVILQGAGLGDGIYRLPATGNETVLDALAQLNGFDQSSSKKLWIARPSRETGSVQILPVDYYSITELAETDTNYQLLPGDRLFIAEDKLVAFDTAIAKFTAPFERIFGFSILGAQTATRFSGRVLKGGGNPVNRGGF